jgi:hypothetical protein
VRRWKARSNTRAPPRPPLMTEDETPLEALLEGATRAGRLLDQLTGSLSLFTADGAYDQDGVYAAVAERHPKRRC